MKTEILERAKLPNGTLVRLQKRGKAYDVITNSTGITWRYLEKAVSEERARNAFDLYTMQHKQNPMKTIQAKRKPTPAQIAARERFAEMARSGAFKKKATKARKKNPLTYGLDGVVNITDTYERSVASSRNLAEHYANQLRMRGRDDIVYVVFGITPEAKAQAGRYRNGVTITLEPRDYEIAYAFHPTQGEISRQLKAQRDAERRAFTRQGMKLKSNPAKKTVSQKISQLTREGYPQKQAVAIALSEERAGKVKRNPSAKDSRTEVHLGGRYYGLIGKGSDLGHYTYIVYRDPRDFEGDKVVPDFNGRYYQSMNAALRALERYKKKMVLENPRASNPIILVSDKPITSKRKANPVKPKDMTVYQVQYRKPGMKLFEPWMTVMYPKMAEDIARRLADEPMAQTWTIKVESIKVKG